MSRLPPDRREVTPSREVGGRRGASFGPRLGVSVPISFGLPLLVVGLFLVGTGAASGRALLWAPGAAAALAGAALLATGKRL